MTKMTRKHGMEWETESVLLKSVPSVSLIVAY